MQKALEHNSDEDNEYLQNNLLPLLEYMCTLKSDTGVYGFFKEDGDRFHSAQVKVTIVNKPNQARDMSVMGDGIIDLGEAMRWVKNGGKIARKGWNSDKQYVYYVPAASYPAHRNVNGTMMEDPDTMVPYNAYLAIMTPNGTVSTWAPSGSDALATDYILL